MIPQSRSPSTVIEFLETRVHVRIAVATLYNMYTYMCMHVAYMCMHAHMQQPHAHTSLVTEGQSLQIHLLTTITLAISCMHAWVPNRWPFTIACSILYTIAKVAILTWRMPCRYNSYYNNSIIQHLVTHYITYSCQN